MASIFKRKKKISVVYRYTDEKGVERQRWETFDNMADAKKRKHQIESQIDDNTFIAPSLKTLRELLAEYLATYGLNNWAISTYDNKQGLITNYINPIIGDIAIQDITPVMMDKYYRSLLKVKSVTSKYVHPRGEYVSPSVIREIHKVLRSAFNMAVKWELVSRNPVENATLPKEQKKTRDIWDAETLFRAIDVCEDDVLKLALNLSFACSLRMGEMLGLTWDCVDISEESIEQDSASIFVSKELQRVKKDTVEKLGDRSIMFQFPSCLGCRSTVLVLKEPKTQSSVRKVFLPKTVAEMLIKHKSDQDEIKEIMGNEYNDYNMVFAGDNGRPIEGSQINRLMTALIRNNNLPHVVFHSIRHTSVTYKLKLNGGDVKSVQGDSGHSQSSMVTDVYSHILDEGRRNNARLFEDAFYSGRNGEMAASKQDTGGDGKEDVENSSQGEVPKESFGSESNVKPTEVHKEESDMETLMRLLKNPEIADALKSLSKIM